MIIFACLIHMIMYHHITLLKTSSTHISCMIIFACLIHMIMYHHITYPVCVAGRHCSTHLHHTSLHDHLCVSHPHDHVSSHHIAQDIFITHSLHDHLCVSHPHDHVSSHHISCLCGRRSTWSLQKGLRRAWSPLARGSCLCGRRSTQSL